MDTPRARDDDGGPQRRFWTNLERFADDAKLEPEVAQIGDRKPAHAGMRGDKPKQKQTKKHSTNRAMSATAQANKAKTQTIER